MTAFLAMLLQAGGRNALRARCSRPSRARLGLPALTPSRALPKGGETVVDAMLLTVR